MSGPVVLVGRWQDTLPGTYDPDRAVVVTDPPYGLKADGGAALRGVGGHMGLGIAKADPTIEKGYLDDIPWSRHVEEVLDLLPAKRHVIRGPATALIRRDYPQPRRVCVEVAAYRRRAANRPGVVPYLWQGWAVYGRLQIERHRQAPRGDGYAASTLLQRDGSDHRGRKTRHRAMTPIQSCAWIVDTWVDPGCIVIDPFAGLGTIGLAARAHGFDYLGSELDPEYAAIANEAFITERMTLGLDMSNEPDEAEMDPCGECRKGLCDHCDACQWTEQFHHDPPEDDMPEYADDEYNGRIPGVA